MYSWSSSGDSAIFGAKILPSFLPSVEDIGMAPPAKRASKRRRTSNKEEPKEEEGRTSNKDEPKEEDDNRKGQQVEETATGGDTAKAIKVTSAEKGTNGKSPVIVFAHGAGAPSSSDWMIRFSFS